MSFEEKLAIAFSVISIILGIATAINNHKYAKAKKEFERNIKNQKK